MNATNSVERVPVMGIDRQVVSQVGLHLLGELADGVGLSSTSNGVPQEERRPGSRRRNDDRVPRRNPLLGRSGRHRPKDARG